MLVDEDKNRCIVAIVVIVKLTIIVSRARQEMCTLAELATKEGSTRELWCLTGETQMSVKLTHTMLKFVLKSTSFSTKSAEFEEINHI